MTKPPKSAGAKTAVRGEIGPDTRFARLAEFLLGRPWPAAVVLALFAAVVLAPRLTPPWHLNHDVAWYCYVAERVLDGATPYVDIIDMNPPLAVYLHIPAAALAKVLHCSDILVFNAYVCSLALVSLALSHAVLRRSAVFPRPALRRFILLILIYVLVASPGPAFGQREHFLVLALLPYLLTGASRVVGRSLGGPSLFLVGLLAGVGVSIKPYFLLAPLVVQAYLLLGPVGKRTLRSPENLGLVTSVGLYVLHFLLLPGEMRSGFVDVARMVAATYGAYERELLVILGQPHVLLCGLFFAFFVFLRPQEHHRQLCRVLALAMGVLFLAGLWQQKGWAYHFLPALACGWLLAGVLVVGVLEREGVVRQLFRPRAGPLMLLLTLGLLAMGAAANLRHFGSPKYGDLSGVVEATQREAAGEPIAALSILIDPAFPLVNYTGLDWSLRFSHLWLLPGVYAHVDAKADPFPYTPPGDMDPIERYLIDAMVADMKARPPRLVFVQTYPPKAIANPRFDFITCLSRDPEFAHIWSHYHYLGDALRHQVFKRKD